MKYWMEMVVLRLLGQIQISGQPEVPAIVEIERPPIHAPHKLSSPVDASLEIRQQRQSSRACTFARSSCSPT
ncbi:hypothetical protein WJX77_004850 [Trebouxia sp. C0004]